MELIFFLVRRFNAARKATGGFSLFSGIVISGIAVGTAALIITLTILKGFEFVLRDRLINLDSHIQIIAHGSLSLRNIDNLIPQIKKTLGDNVVSTSYYLDRYVLAGHGRKREGITMRGITATYFDQKLSIKPVAGSLSLNKDGTMVMGKYLAQRMFVKPGDKVTVFALKRAAVPDADNPPILEQFTVTGIFESGIAQFDDQCIYVPIKQVARMFELDENAASNIEIRLSSADSIAACAKRLKEVLPPTDAVVDIYQLYPQIFTWIELQKKPIPIILSLIVLVAVFNVISVTLMLALDKNKAIGILRTLGAPRRVIGVLFFLQGVYLAFIGIFIGNVLAYTLCTLQMKYNIITLPSSIYFTATVPMLIEPGSFLLVSAVGFIMSVLVSVLPAYIASRFSPVTTLRFQ
ncbi:MAG: ABC transporter permease [Ignavibacteriales bacterium]|nr:ABC transporter permease [Ignavibacteriales bacterium]